MSITPSSPRLITPERWAIVSPVAASSSGVATRTAAAGKPPASRTASAPSSSALRGPDPSAATWPPRADARFREQHGQDDDRLDHVYRDGRHAGLALHRSRAGLERAEEQSGEHDTERMQPAEQGDGDGGEAVPGREILKQRVGDAADLDAAGEPGDRAREREGERRQSPAVDPPADLRRPRAESHRAEPEAPQGAAKEPRAAHSAGEREQQPRMQPRPGQDRQPRALGDRIALGIDVLTLLQRPLHHQAGQSLRLRS